MIQTYEIYQCQSFAGLREKEGGKICLVFDHLAALEAAGKEKDERITELESCLNIFGEDPCWCELLIEKCADITKQEQQIAALGARNKELEDMWDAVQSMSTCTVEYENDLVRANKQIAALTAERDRLREALDTIEGMATIETVEIQKIAQKALKQTEPEKEYDDLTSTIDEQQEFERGCLERLSLLTKQTEGGGE